VSRGDEAALSVAADERDVGNQCVEHVCCGISSGLFSALRTCLRGTIVCTGIMVKQKMYLQMLSNTLYCREIG
jgi:hypothetical protein